MALKLQNLRGKPSLLFAKNKPKRDSAGTAVTGYAARQKREVHARAKKRYRCDRALFKVVMYTRNTEIPSTSDLQYRKKQCSVIRGNSSLSRVGRAGAQSGHRGRRCRRPHGPLSIPWAGTARDPPYRRGSRNQGGTGLQPHQVSKKDYKSATEAKTGELLSVE